MFDLPIAGLDAPSATQEAPRQERRDDASREFCQRREFS